MEQDEAGRFVHGTCLVWDDDHYGILWLVNDHPVEYIRVRLRLPRLAGEQQEMEMVMQGRFPAT